VNDTAAQAPIRSFDFARGEVLLVDKPLHWTSFDVVARMRTLTRCRKIGHAGTLDPLATGLLVLCTGAATKRIDTLQATEKEYEAEFRLGYVTASYDAEMPPEPVADASAITLEQVTQALVNFTGDIRQRPPAYSAVKVGGKRAYAAARAGQTLDIPERTVTIYKLELTAFEAESATGKLLIWCSKGTYVRSLVHDLGQALGVGAYLTGLRRTRSGEHSVAEAFTLEQWAALLQPAQVMDSEHAS
jgi:tRNA pseudouridine55 synthase